MTIRCDGTAFKIAGHTPPLMSSRGPGVITITDRVTSAPVSPTPGARYIVQTRVLEPMPRTTSSRPTASPSTSTRRPTDCGWIAYVQDENRYYSFQGSAWVLGLEPAASATVAGVQENADQAEMEARSSILRSVSAGTQHFHPAHPKAGGILNGTGTPALLLGRRWSGCRHRQRRWNLFDSS